MEQLYFKFLGTPKPKQSFRFTKTGHRYQKADVVQHERSLAIQVMEVLPQGFVPFDVPIEMKCVFVFPYPASFNKKKLAEAKEGKVFYKDTKPDVTDNLNKGVCDAMEGLVFINDSRIAKFSAEKIYGDTPRTEIWITKL
jgi:Holliday junction resolvase RusA-like endonuclease